VFLKCDWPTSCRSLLAASEFVFTIFLCNEGRPTCWKLFRCGWCPLNFRNFFISPNFISPTTTEFLDYRLMKPRDRRSVIVEMIGYQNVTDGRRRLAQSRVWAH